MFTLHTVHRDGRNGHCTRRALLQGGVLGGLGLATPALLKAHAHPAPRDRAFGRAKRCIVLFLSGGASQHDTWDPKPDAPAEVRGELGSIATTAPTVRVGELFPRVARQARHACFVRSVTHADALHTVAGYQMLTGWVHSSSGKGGNSVDRRPLPTDHPYFGSLVMKVRPPLPGVPSLAALPEVLTDGGITAYPGQFGGMLGRRFDPLYLQGDYQSGRFRTPDLILPVDVDEGRLADRRRLLEQLNAARRAAERSGALAEFDGFRQQAFEIVGSPAVQAAFDLDRESPEVRAAYGPHLFGQSCLMGRRLLEAGVPLVTVYWPQDNGTKCSPVWDTHEDQAGNLRTRLAPHGDAAIASLLGDLAERGLLDDTLLACLTEFGRTPKITNRGGRTGGREHWPFVYSILLAGAGIQGGRAYGASDPLGAHPASQPVSPSDLVASLLHLLGVPGDLELTDPQLRPFRAAAGRPITALWDA